MQGTTVSFLGMTLANRNAIDWSGQGQVYGTSATATFVFRANNYNFYNYSAGTIYAAFTGTAATFYMPVSPGPDNTYALGSASARWSQLYAGTSTINTSDRAEKTSFRLPDEAVLLAALDTDRSFYQWVEAIARKGEAKARWHFGPTAQGFAQACRARGVDPATLAVYCEDAVLAPVKKRRVVDGLEEEYEEMQPTGEDPVRPAPRSVRPALGFETGDLDTDRFAEAAAQLVAAASFISSTVFRIAASRRLMG